MEVWELKRSIHFSRYRFLNFLSGLHPEWGSLSPSRLIMNLGRVKVGINPLPILCIEIVLWGVWVIIALVFRILLGAR